MVSSVLLWGDYILGQQMSRFFMLYRLSQRRCASMYLCYLFFHKRLLTWISCTWQVPYGVCERLLPRSEATDDQRSGCDASNQGAGVWGAGGAAKGVPRSGVILFVVRPRSKLNGSSTQRPASVCRCDGRSAALFSSLHRTLVCFAAQVRLLLQK